MRTILYRAASACLACTAAIVAGFVALPVAALGEEAVAAYRIGPEDTISVTVARHPEFSGVFFVPADGSVNLPTVGLVKVTGKTVTELSEEIREALKTRLRDPEVTVSLQAPRMQRVYVLGAVEKPGLYDVKPGWRITEAIAAAGGLPAGTEQADCKATILRARNGRRHTTPLVDVFKGAPEANVAIESGDVLTVETQETMPIYVTGRVKTPGLYKLRKNTPGVVQAIALAGGSTEDAALDRITITHVDQTTRTLNLLPAVSDGQQDANVSLQPGDLVVVPEETGRIAILGYVAEPNFYPLKSGQKVRLSDAIGMARGIEKNKKGESGSVVVIRMENGKQVSHAYNLAKFFKSGDITQNPELKSGDVVYVPRSKGADWDYVIRSLTAIGILINPFVP